MWDYQKTFLNYPSLSIFFGMLNHFFEEQLFGSKSGASGFLTIKSEGNLSYASKVLDVSDALASIIPIFSGFVQAGLNLSSQLLKGLDQKKQLEHIQTFSQKIGTAHHFKQEMLEVAIALAERYQNQLLQLDLNAVKAVWVFAASQIMTSLLEDDINFNSPFKSQLLDILAEPDNKKLNLLKEIKHLLHTHFNGKIKTIEKIEWSVKGIFNLSDIITLEGATYGKDNLPSKYGYRLGSSEEAINQQLKRHSAVKTEIAFITVKQPKNILDRTESLALKNKAKDDKSLFRKYKILDEKYKRLSQHQEESDIEMQKLREKLEKMEKAQEEKSCIEAEQQAKKANNIKGKFNTTSRTKSFSIFKKRRRP